MISPATRLLLRAARACRRGVDPVSIHHVPILFLLRDTGPSAIRSIVAATGAPYNTTAKAIECLEASGVVAAPRHANRRTPRLWSLTPAGQALLASIDPPPVP